MKDLAIIRARVRYLGAIGVIAAAGAVALILAGHPVEGMSVFALATTVAGIMGGAPRSSAPLDDQPPPAPASPPAPAVSVEEVTTDNLVGWIATADRWGPDDLEAH